MKLAAEIATGAAGGLAGGAVMTAAMVGGKTSGLIPDPLPLKFERNLERRLGMEGRVPPAPQTGLALTEHLLISATLGALYGLVRSAVHVRPLAAGPLYGVAVYGLMLGVVGPALGATKTPSGTARTTTARRMMMHAVFGTVTALVVDRLHRTRRASPTLSECEVISVIALEAPADAQDSWS